MQLGVSNTATSPLLVFSCHICCVSGMFVAFLPWLEHFLPCLLHFCTPSYDSYTDNCACCFPETSSTVLCLLTGHTIAMHSCLHAWFLLRLCMFTLVTQGAVAGTYDAYLHPVGELAGLVLSKVQALAGSEVCPRCTCSAQRPSCQCVCCVC